MQTVQILIDYLGFLIDLKFETITKIANKIEQFPAEIIQKPQHIRVFRSDCIIFSYILLISNSMVSRAIIKGQWQQKMLLFHLKERLKSSLKSCYICFISCLILEIF